MKSNSYKRTLTATSIALALSMAGGSAFAAGGTIASVSATPGKFASSAVTATPSGQSAGHEINFKLPLVGDTQNCVINISYGDKPGAMPNNDGDTHLNGQSSLDRVRTYAADGTYTFTAKAKSGCTGEAKVTFTIGTPGKPADSGAPRAGIVPSTASLPMAAAIAPVVVNANPGLVVAHTKIISMQVSSNYMQAGGTLTVKVNGTGVESQCPTTVLVVNKSSNYYKTSDKVATGAWPRTSVFQLPEAGKYWVSVYPMAKLSSEERTACGFKYSYENSGIAGSGAIVEVVDIPK